MDAAIKIEYAARGIRVLDALPEGWKYIRNPGGSFNSPVNGWCWAYNGRSRFRPGFEHALVPVPKEGVA